MLQQSRERSIVAPRDRQVILVASRDQLVDYALKASATTPLTKLGSLLSGVVGETARREFKLRALKKLDDRSLVREIEASLGIARLTRFTPAEATRFFDFGVGHSPQGGAIYVQHPVLADAYIAPEDFSRALAKEKEAAFRLIASALGARELRLVSAKVHTKKGLFKTTISIPEAATEVGVKATFDSTGSVVSSVASTFGEPRKRPHVPQDLKSWVTMDPDLRTMARDRIEGSLLEHNVTLEFKESSNVGGDVAAKVAGRGLTAGGSYEQLAHSVWNFSVSYWPATR